MSNVLDAWVRFLADTKGVDAALDKDIPAAAQRAGDKAGQNMGSAIGKAFTAAGAAGGVVFTSAIEGATAFEDQLATINTVARLGQEELQGVGKGILDLSRETGKSTDDLTAGFYDLVSAGVPAGEAMKVLKDSAVLATGALGTTNEAVDLVTSAMGAYGLSASESTRITDIFAQSVADGKTTVADLAGGISTVAPIAAAAGVSLEEVAAATAVMTLKGDTASQAMTRIKAAISALLTPNEALNKIQERTGTNFADMLKEGVPLTVVLDELRKATEGNEEEFAKALGSTEALTLAFATTGENAAAMAGELGKVTTESQAGGVALEQYNIAQGSAAAGGRRLTAQIKAFLIEMGGPFVQTLGPALQTLNLLGPSFGRGGIAAKIFGGIVGGITGRAILPAIGALKNLAAAGRLGGFLQDVSLGRGLGKSLIAGIQSLGRSGPVKAATAAAGAVLGPIFQGAMFVGSKLTAAAVTAINAIPGGARAAAFAAGAAGGAAYAAGFVAGLLALPALVLLGEEVKKKIEEGLGDNLLGSGLKQELEKGGVGKDQYILWFNIGKEGQKGFKDGLTKGVSTLKGGDLVGPIEDTLSEAAGIREAAAAVGDAIEEPIRQGIDDSVTSVRSGAQSILSAIEGLRSDLVAAATGAANALYDPILAAQRLAETQSELRAVKLKLLEKGLTDDQVKELQRRRQELGKQLIIQNGEFLTYGTEAEQISKIKAFLASGFWTEAYEDALPEQKAALDDWKQALQDRLDAMERSAQEGGGDLRDGFVGELQKGGKPTEQAINTWSAAANTAFANASANAKRWGLSTGKAYAAGLEASYGYVNGAVQTVLSALTNGMRASSPPGPKSPLHHIDDWGQRTFEAWADGILRATPAAFAAAMAVSRAAATGVGVVDPLVGVSGSGGSLATASAAASSRHTTVPGVAPTKHLEYHIHAEGQLKVPDPLAAANLLARFQGSGLLPEGEG